MQVPAESDEPTTLADLRVVINEIADFAHMGDNDVIPEAARALLAVLKRSGKRLRALHHL